MSSASHSSGTPRSWRRAASVFTALVLLVGGCSDGDAEPETATSTTAPGAGPVELEAQVASYDLIVGQPQRLLIGLVAGEGRVVTGGEVEVHFAHLPGPGGASATANIGEAHTAQFQPIAGSKASQDGPRLSRPSEGVGVYAIADAAFDKPGRWGLIANVRIGDKTTTAQGVFNVAAVRAVPGAGDPAPKTANPLPGGDGADSASIDSRAKDGAEVPDPALHATRISDAIAAGRPAVVVVSTPVYCVSRFCGPITDSIEKLAAQYTGRADFVHLEVWRNFEKKQVNVAAAEWIYRSGRGDLLEPWVFVISRDGTITHRFDNIATDAELQAAVDAVTA